MSIIHEALKKAGSIKKAKDAPVLVQEAQDTGTSEKTVPRKHADRNRVLIFSVIAALSAILVTATNYLLNTVAVQQKVISVPKIQPILEQIKTPEFELTGIAYTDNEPMAVINGAVYSEGELVNGARVVKITNKTVLLEKEGNSIELTVK